jgi:hypothetical protein
LQLNSRVRGHEEEDDEDREGFPAAAHGPLQPRQGGIETMLDTLFLRKPRRSGNPVE